MTIKEMMHSTKPWLTPAEVAEVLVCDPHSIRVMAATKPEQLGFPIIRIGRETKIPRIPFLRHLGYEPEETL